MFVAPAAALIAGAAGVTIHAAPLIGTTTIYVATTGSDSNPCANAHPCATLQHAVDNAPGGGIIKVDACTCNQTVNITEPLTLQGAGASSTILDGANIDTEAMPTLVQSPDGALVVEPDSGVYNVTEINNRIHVIPWPEGL